MKRKVKSLLVITAFIVFGAFFLLRFSSGLRSVIPPELRSLRVEDFGDFLPLFYEILGESEPDLDGDGKKEKVLLYAHTLTRVFLSVKWGDRRGVEKISQVIGEDYDVSTRVFVTDMDGDGREEVAAIVPTAKRTTNLAIWKFDTDARKMQMVGKVPFMLVSRWNTGAMQILDVNGDGKKEIVSFLSSGSFWGFGGVLSLDLDILDVQVVWMEAGRVQSNRKQFVVHRTVWLLPSLICPPPMRWIPHFKAKVMTVMGRRFYVAPFIASVQRLNLREIALWSCIPQEEKHYAAVFEVKTVDPSNWQFIGRSILR